LIKKKIIAGNWKMHKTVAESLAFMRDLGNRQVALQAEVIIFPPATALAAMSAERTAGIKLGAQNIHFQSKGAYTGEISAAMVRELADYVLVGHSERRELFNESDEDVNRKIKAALSVGLRPICCLGETLAERDAGRTSEKVFKQLEAAFQGLSVRDMKALIIAYEPIWAIGTGRNAGSGQAQEIHGLIRSWLGERIDDAHAVPILYGGSAKPENSGELLAEQDIDGLLIGGASLLVDSFCAIIQNSPK